MLHPFAFLALRGADTDSTIEMFFEDYETYDDKNDTPMIGNENSTYLIIIFHTFSIFMF